MLRHKFCVKCHLCFTDETYYSCWASPCKQFDLCPVFDIVHVSICVPLTAGVTHLTTSV